MYMDYITTTELRTQIPKLIANLFKGNRVNLVHRSKIVGEIIPKKKEIKKSIDPKKFAAALKQLEPKKKVSLKKLMKNYEHYMMYRHGPNFS